MRHELPPCPVSADDQPYVKQYCDAKADLHELGKKLQARSLGARLLRSWALRVQIDNAKGRLRTLEDIYPDAITDSSVESYQQWQNSLIATIDRSVE